MFHSKKKLILSIVFHFTGILMLFLAFSAYFMSASTGFQIYGLLGESQFSEQIIGSLFLLFLMTSAVWGIGFFAFRTFDRNRRNHLTKTRGSIMTETLIVIPVFLLMTSGLAQMGINSMAGILTTVGAYEAGRTIAVWGPEIGNDRMDGVPVDAADVLEKAKLAVAVVVTPVARSTRNDVNACPQTAELTKFLGGLTATGVSDSPEAGAIPVIWKYIESFGTESFGARAPAKLKSAYCSVTINPSSLNGIPNGEETKGADFIVRVSYQHKTVFPLVSKVFGVSSNIQRAYRMRSVIPPNDCLPESPNFFNLNNCSRD